MSWNVLSNVLKFSYILGISLEEMPFPSLKEKAKDSSFDDDIAGSGKV